MRVFLLLVLVAAVLGDGLHGGRRGGRAGNRAGPRRGGRVGGQAPRRGRQDAAPGGYAAPDAAPADGGYAAPTNDVPVYANEDALGGYSADDAGSDPALDMLASSIPGVPGEDYPIYAEVPESGFSCDGQVDGGYYADPEAECQVFHICTADGQGGLGKYSFLCPNGTIFNQNYFICDWWFNFDCSEAEAIAEEKNAELAAAREEASASDDQSAYGDASDDSYAAPTELPAYDEYPTYDEVTEALAGYEETTFAPVGGYAAPQEERRRKSAGGRSGRRLQNGRGNGRRPAQSQRSGPRQFRG